MVCTFFGHSDCFDLDSHLLAHTIEELIQKGVDTFYVGHQGHFDRIVLGCLVKLHEKYPHISFSVVLAYLPTQTATGNLYDSYSLYPEIVGTSLPKFAIERRNKWMIEQANYCLCYIQHTWGGAYKFAKLAKKKGLTIINLSTIKF